MKAGGCASTLGGLSGQPCLKGSNTLHCRVPVLGTGSGNQPHPTVGLSLLPPDSPSTERGFPSGLWKEAVQPWGSPAVQKWSLPPRPFPGSAPAVHRTTGDPSPSALVVATGWQAHRGPRGLREVLSLCPLKWRPDTGTLIISTGETPAVVTRWTLSLAERFQNPHLRAQPLVPRFPQPLAPGFPQSLAPGSLAPATKGFSLSPPPCQTTQPPWAPWGLTLLSHAPCFPPVLECLPPPSQLLVIQPCGSHLLVST